MHSAKRLAEEFNIDMKKSYKIKNAIRKLNHEEAMEAINEALGGCGVEVLRADNEWDSYYGDIVAEYVNMGDTYDVTILYDINECKYEVTSWGDWVEMMENENVYCFS